MSQTQTFGFCARITRRLDGLSNPLRTIESARSLVVATDGLEIAWSARHDGELPGEAWLCASPDVIATIAGRIDNRTDVAYRLGAPELLSRGDAPLLAQAYRAWGRDLVAHLIGEYSFLIVDRRSGIVTAGRDALGVGRLYFSEGPREISFASHLGGVLGLLPSMPDVDRESLFGYLSASGYFVDERTPYRGVRGIPPGHVLTVRRNAIELARSWHPDPSRRVVASRAEEYCEQLRALLFEAVAHMLPRTTPALVDVSGGLDSSTVAAFAALIANGGFATPRPMAFSYLASATSDFDAPEYPEALVRHCGLTQRTVDLDEYLPCAEIDTELLLLPDRWLFNGAAKRAQREVVTSTGAHTWLTGDGGDQLFWAGPEPVFLGEYFRLGTLTQWLRLMRGFAKQNRYSIRRLLEYTFTDGTPVSPGQEPPPRWLSPEHAQAIVEEWLERERGRLKLSRRVGWNVQLERLMLTARAVQRKPATCDVRFPFLHRPLVEFMLAVPWELKEIPGQGRVLQRHALSGILPESILARQSKGSFASFFVKGLSVHWDNMERFTAGRRLADLGLIVPAPFTASCERLRHGQSPERAKRLLIAALTLEAWLESRPRQPSDFETPLSPSVLAEATRSSRVDTATAGR